MKKLNFVYDKKSGDMLAPHFVPNHVVAIRDYQSMDSKDAIFKKFPGDFLLVTVGFGAASSESGDFGGCCLDGFEATEFRDIVGDNNAG